MMHLKKIILRPDSYPSEEYYPFNLGIFRSTLEVSFDEPVTFFAGENGSGKSTLLKAIARKCGIHIWSEEGRRRYRYNEYEDELYRFIDLEWNASRVPGSFFASEIFRHFAEALDEWAAASPGFLEYYGGKSLVTQSHGQCHMSYFRNRFGIKGLYLLDEPENALSPGKQIELAGFLKAQGEGGEAQFIIASHSPILLSMPDAAVYSFDCPSVTRVRYCDTEHFKTYRDFFMKP